MNKITKRWFKKHWPSIVLLFLYLLFLYLLLDTIICFGGDGGGQNTIPNIVLVNEERDTYVTEWLVAVGTFGAAIVAAVALYKKRK